jgi:quinolinate synthase
LLVGQDSLAAQGSFAKLQAEYLQPDQDRIKDLGGKLKEKNMGVIAHFYMDAELQGHLSGVRDWEHIFVSDSLAMGEAAVGMAKKGVSSIACLGVDFMSESARARLNQEGFRDVKVFRLAENEIGCSLAASAERPAYWAWLEKAQRTTKNNLHVIYINTSMETKAKSNSIMPTITCTSSNVVQTVLTAAVDVPDLNVYYGPDTYMGENLQQLFVRMLDMSDEDIQKFHPQHDRASIKALLSRFHYYQQGICVVHHMFGGQVTKTVAEEYPLDDTTFYTAHFEVPGEMFTLAIGAMHDGKGVVGSTSNILNFIVGKTKEAASKGIPKVRFILGTESGMVTGIVRGLQQAIPAGSATQAEIIFPVNSEAFSPTDEPASGLALVPGVKSGEGCSAAGGCASCPYMKMNDLDSLFDLVDSVPTNWEAGVPKSLVNFQPKTKDTEVNGVPLVEAGAVPIKYMRHLMANEHLSPELVAAVTHK